MNKIHIGILGGGPAALFTLKRFAETFTAEASVTIIERNSQLGAGMPYSTDGACHEHITNVSDREIPAIVSSLTHWIKHAPQSLLKEFNIDPASFDEYKVVPRLVFGKFLASQFDLTIKSARKAGIHTNILLNTTVTDISFDTDTKKITAITEGGNHVFDIIVLATGHNWPTQHEGKVPNWFDSPYPPSKLPGQYNFPIAIKGSSLTAIDAVKTLAKANGYYEEKDGTLIYHRHASSPNFHITLHSIHGLLPAVRFHLENVDETHDIIPTEAELREVMAANEGFIPLDYIYQRNFLEPLRQEHPEFYEKVKHMPLEEFVESMMSLRENIEPFTLFRAEYAEAEKSIRRKRSIYWKEMLSQLSYAMNYPAKHFPAEDMTRMQTVLKPLISIVIAMVPQRACRELLALHDAGVLDVVAVDKDSTVEPADEGCIYTYTNDAGNKIVRRFPLFINGVGQPPFAYEDFPFESLRRDQAVSPAYLQYRSKDAGKVAQQEKGEKEVITDSNGNYFLLVPGISINDQFQVLNRAGAANQQIYIMAVPYIAGLNPDYSGLDFCETASSKVASAIADYMQGQ